MSMKFIHTADIHLGSKMDSRFPRSISAKRKEELRTTFQRMVAYARANGVRAIILAGDVFDSDTPTIRDKDFFHGVVKTAPDVDFLYLKGNHDLAAHAEETLPNLKTFGEQWQYYDYGDITVAGAELSQNNAASVYSTLTLKEDRTNIVVLHGQIGDAAEKGGINLKRLRDKNIDYLALGHIHKRQNGKLDDRGDYAYCGCLEGRGFDEIGPHGFILLDAGERITRSFVPFAARTITEAAVDISGVQDAYMAAEKVKRQLDFNANDIYRVNLTGAIDSGVELSVSDVAAYLSNECYFADVKDRTSKTFDWESFEGDLSLKGEFVRTVLGDPDLSQEEKTRIATIGLKALSGGDIEL